MSYKEDFWNFWKEIKKKKENDEIWYFRNYRQKVGDLRTFIHFYQPIRTTS